MKKKKFKNYKLAKKFTVKRNLSRGFYMYSSPHHLFSRKRFIFSPLRYIDYSQNRKAAKEAKTFKSYKNIFWTFILFAFIVFDLYWFKRIFKRSIEREKATLFDKRYKRKLKLSAIFFKKVKWSRIGWEYFDINGMHMYTWWGFGHFTESFYGTIKFIEDSATLADNTYCDFSDPWYWKTYWLLLNYKPSPSLRLDDAELERTDIGIWHRITEHLNELHGGGTYLGTPTFQTVIFPDGMGYPIDWWFYFFS